jgi:hypothetical protein
MEKKLGPEAMLRKLAEMRKSLAGNDGKKLDAEAILQTLAEMRESLPGIAGTRRSTDAHDGRSMLPNDVPAETEEDFEYAAVIDALQSFAADVDAVAEEARARVIESALQVYYAAEELARDPANAELIQLVQKMSEAYERDFRRPIPPRKPRDE